MYKRWMDLASTLLLSLLMKQLSSSRPSAMDRRARCLRVDLQLLREEVRPLSSCLPRPTLLQGRGACEGRSSTASACRVQMPAQGRAAEGRPGPCCGRPGDRGCPARRPAACTPARILRRHPDHELLHVDGHGRTPRPAAREPSYLRAINSRYQRRIDRVGRDQARELLDDLLTAERGRGRTALNTRRP